MPLERYTYSGPVDHTVPIDYAKVKGKSVIITGGANGIGEAAVRLFVQHGAFVTFADMNDRGVEIDKELNASGRTCAFVRCDIRSWDDQVKLFETAKSQSPAKSVDVVIANAGISRSSHDSLWELDDPNGPPTKPNLNIVKTNIDGTLYTFKLAVHYFRKQPDTAERDRCFIITGSMTAWIDSPANWEYTVTKYGLRGLFRTVRRNSHEQGVRINYVAPCWIRSAIRSAEYEKWLEDNGAEFATGEDVARSFIRISTDKSINGRSLMNTAPSVAKEGFIDSNREDYDDRPEDAYLHKLQVSQLKLIKVEWK